MKDSDMPSDVNESAIQGKPIKIAGSVFFKNIGSGAYQQALFVMIAMLFCLRLIPAAWLELGNDEVYYITYSPHLQWNYFDHPPMVALWIRIFTANQLLISHELFVRLGSLVSCGISSWIMFRIGLRLHSARAGFFIALLYNSSIYAGIIAGLFIMPDGPQMLFWTWSLLQLTKLSFDEAPLKNWLLFGLTSGLCMMSKVHAIFIFGGLGLYILFSKRSWLRQPGLYLGTCLAVLIFLPVVFWNIHNDFITYRYHSARVTPGFDLHLLGFFRELMGQIVYNNPVNVVLVILGVLNFKKLMIKKSERDALTLFNYIALPMISVLLVLALFRDTLPHWSGPAYVTLLPLGGIKLAIFSKRNIPGVLKWALGIFVFFILTAFTAIHLLPGTIGKTDKKETYGQNDISLDLYGWKDASTQFQKIYQFEQQYGDMPFGAPVIAMKWFPAAHEDYYICRPLKISLIGVGEPYDLHQFLWLNKWRVNGVNMNSAWFIMPTNVPVDVVTELKSSYREVRFFKMFASYRNGKICRYFMLYKLKGWQGTIRVAGSK